MKIARSDALAPSFIHADVPIHVGCKEATPGTRRRGRSPDRNAGGHRRIDHRLWPCPPHARGHYHDALPILGYSEACGIEQFNMNDIAEPLKFRHCLAKVILVAKQQSADVLDHRNARPRPVHRVQKHRKAIPRITVPTLIPDLAERLARWATDYDVRGFRRHPDAERNLLACPGEVCVVCRHGDWFISKPSVRARPPPQGRGRGRRNRRTGQEPAAPPDVATAARARR